MSCCEKCRRELPDAGHCFAGYGFFVCYCPACCPRVVDGWECDRDGHPEATATAGDTELAALLPPDDTDHWPDWYRITRLALADWLEERQDQRAEAVRSLEVHDEMEVRWLCSRWGWPLESIRLVRSDRPGASRGRRCPGVEVRILGLGIPGDPLILWRERLLPGKEVLTSDLRFLRDLDPRVLRIGASGGAGGWSVSVHFCWRQTGAPFHFYNKVCDFSMLTAQAHTRQRVLALFPEVRR